ncbi:MAG: type III-A CRISPR-associated RAMP protein Csm4 [Christensenellaceae bacterium]|nr:type III-A CRISPR-associated RAMP protein Csm4 [Christensenellaceae bacterium]
MNRSIVRMKFLSPIHIGVKNLSDSEYSIKADTLFSALCLECKDIEEFVNYTKAGNLKISDAMPYIDDYYYIPKPMLYVKQKTDNYKLFKKIKYIPFDAINPFLEGTLYPEDELESFLLGEEDIRTQVCIGQDPFVVGTYTFYNNSGLYLIVEHKDEKVFELFNSLQYTGIGGKRSGGLGRFEYTIEKCFDFEKGNTNILLNSSMAKPAELENCLEDANYMLQKRSGFINQSRYKKQDFYTFTAGSVFKNTFEGDIYDVGNDEHPVYRYAIPMFMEVNV